MSLYSRILQLMIRNRFTSSSDTYTLHDQNNLLPLQIKSHRHTLFMIRVVTNLIISYTLYIQHILYRSGASTTSSLHDQSIRFTRLIFLPTFSSLWPLKQYLGVSVLQQFYNTAWLTGSDDSCLGPAMRSSLGPAMAVTTRTPQDAQGSRGPHLRVLEGSLD